VRVSDRPADARHPYGHGKVECVSGLVEAALIFGAAAYIVYEAAQRLIHGAKQLEPGLGILVMAVSAVTNTVVSRMLFRVARETDSLALQADAEHLRTDVITSAGVVGGLTLVQVTDWFVVDPLIAIAVALLICGAASRLTMDALHGLLDTRLPESDLQVVLDILDTEPAVLAYHKLRTRRSGSSRHIDAHILVADDLTLTDAHDLTEALEHRVRQRLPRTEIVLHTEPHDAEMLHQHTEHGGPKPP
jgi:cation diffusion facilitator family transporter